MTVSPPHAFTIANRDRRSPLLRVTSSLQSRAPSSWSGGGAMIVRRVLACVAGALLVMGLAGTPAGAAIGPSAVPSSLFLAQPSTVCGYSQHALDRMATRGISPLDVRTTVALGADSAFRNDHGNWQYESGGLIVVMNDAGCVVTAFTR
jgi:hypothetical protein